MVSAHGDADVDIVKTEVETSLQHTTALIGEDTDLLVLLLYYAQGEVMNLYFRSDKPKADGTIEVYHINRIQEVLGHEICSQLMFIHDMTGSDTTSRIFGVGKKTAFQYLAKGDPVLRSCAIAFTIPNQTTEVIDNLGCQAKTVPFGGKGTDSLATMRYNIFSKKISVSAAWSVTRERLAQSNLLPNFIVVEHTTRSWSGQEKRRIWIPGTGSGNCNTIGSSPTYVNDECCSRQSVENHTLQLFDCLQNTALLL